MTAAMSGTPAKVTSARFVARLTDAETTPGVARIAFSTRSTQESQAMPSTRMLKAAGFFGLEKREDIDVSFTNDLGGVGLLDRRSSRSGATTSVTKFVSTRPPVTSGPAKQGGELRRADRQLRAAWRLA